MKREEVLRCSFSSWYDAFKDVTIRSHCLTLSAEFLEYLLADGIVLPQSALAEEQVEEEKTKQDDFDDTDWDSDQLAVAPSFPDFEKKVKECIKDLGGKIFPKLNWSSPKDATWMSFDRTLKCVCPADIYILLKSSDFVTHDLTEPFSSCEDYVQGASVADFKFELVLRKWCDLNPGMEFRCFVRDKKLIAVCQRDYKQYYAFLPDMKEEILSEIKVFFKEIVRGKFPCSNYVFDVYRREESLFWVLDFNPFGEVTDPLMFSWEELSDMNIREENFPEFRCLEKESNVSGSEYSNNAVPLEVSELASQEDYDKLLAMFQTMPGDENESDSESNSNDESVTIEQDCHCCG